MNELTESQEIFVDQIKTGWRKEWWVRFLRAAKSNNDIIIPPSVESMRAMNKKLKSSEQRLDDFITGFAKAFKGVNQITSFLEKISGKQ